MAFFWPILLPRTCPCGFPIDPVGLHFLSCSFTHFGFTHERVKHAVISRVKSFHSPDIAPLVVLGEQPVRDHYPLRNDVAEEGAALIDDIVLSLQGVSHQEPIIGDLFLASLGNALALCNL